MSLTLLPAFEICPAFIEEEVLSLTASQYAMAGSYPCLTCLLPNRNRVMDWMCGRGKMEGEGMGVNKEEENAVG